MTKNYFFKKHKKIHQACKRKLEMKYNRKNLRQNTLKEQRDYFNINTR